MTNKKNKIKIRNKKYELKKCFYGLHLANLINYNNLSYLQKKQFFLVGCSVNFFTLKKNLKIQQLKEIIITILPTHVCMYWLYGKEFGLFIKWTNKEYLINYLKQYKKNKEEGLVYEW